jgi:hypothetical protein
MQLRTMLIGSLVGTALAGFVALSSVDTRLPGLNSGYQPSQPIAYSHRVHAGENRMDCLFCHTAAEKGRHAGIPPLSTCMKCHEKIVNKPGGKELSPEIAKLTKAFQEGRPVEWQRVHRLPAYVYFDHSRHVNGGVACQNCHGDVQTMEAVSQAKELTMGECLTCHRDSNKKFVQSGKPAAAPTDCSSCHH